MSRRFKPTLLATSLLVAAMLSACGGGGSGTTDSPASDTQAPPAKGTETPPTGELPTLPTNPTNTVPVSNAGTAQSTVTGKSFTLDGSTSTDADGDTLTYRWTVTTQPATSTAALSSATVAKPTFTAVVDGDYVFSLVVNDGKADSAAASVTVTVAKATWRDADCSTDGGSKLPACAVNFSDNDASATMADGVLQLATGTALATVKSTNTGIMGNRAILGTEILHELPVADFPGISFKSMDDGLAAPGAGLPYVTYTINTTCGPAGGWANLITNLTDMTRSAPDADGFYTYSVDLDSAAWKSTNNKKSLYAPAPNETTVVLEANNGVSAARSLRGLLTYYPDACIYNWPNPDAVVPGATKTPAVMLLLGSSGNTTAKTVWFKDLKIGSLSLF